MLRLVASLFALSLTPAHLRLLAEPGGTLVCAAHRTPAAPCVHRSTKELEAAIKNFIQHHNRDPKPFIWHKTADQILDSVTRFCKRTLDSGH